MRAISGSNKMRLALQYGWSVRQRREAAKLAPKAVAQATGISEERIGRIEGGEGAMRLVEVLAIEQALGSADLVPRGIVDAFKGYTKS